MLLKVVTGIGELARGTGKRKMRTKPNLHTSRLSVTSFPIFNFSFSLSLCSFPAPGSPLPVSRSPLFVSRFSNNLLVPHNYIDMLNCILFISILFYKIANLCRGNHGGVKPLDYCGTYQVRSSISQIDHSTEVFVPPGGEVLPYNWLMGMCRWMGSHFHDWIDYNGVTFSIELPEWGRTFSDFWSMTVLHIYG